MTPAGRVLDHRVLSGHLVRRARSRRRDLGEHVEVRAGGLDHDDVGALVDVGEASCTPSRPLGVELVRAPVALQGRLDGVAERTVERRGVLRGVREQHDVTAA
jgi:hypothetical protein